MKTNKLINDLTQIINSQKILSKRSECIAYSRDMSPYSAIPDIVVLPDSVKDIQAVLKFASKESIPVTPRGAGTSVTGAVIPIQGGIVVDLSHMNKIHKINLTDKYAVVDSGVICSCLNAELAPGFFFPPDPGSSDVATIGGMISTNASGRKALKYGTTGNYVMSVDVVLSSGEIIRSGHHTPKSSAGFDITNLFTSAEGTIGIITRATLKILPCPESIAVCLAGFSSLEAAAEAAVELISSNIRLSSCELMDCISVNEFSSTLGLDFKNTQGMLIIEIDGHQSIVSDSINIVQKQCKKLGATDIYIINDSAERGRVWRFRSKLISSISPEISNARLIPMAEDIGVPVSRLPEAIKKIKQYAEMSKVPIVLFGHAGDGNIHTTFVLDPLDKDGWNRALDLAGQLINLALELEGTISAEHGIGLAKAQYIGKDKGANHKIMKQIKHLFDPFDIMNPGKLGFSEESNSMFDNFAFSSPKIALNQHPRSNNIDIDKESLLCMMCGSCRSVCPVFVATGMERDNARSKVQLLYALRTGEIDLSEDFADVFYKCTKCGACEQNCPSDIKVVELINAARNQLSNEGIFPSSIKEIPTMPCETGAFLSRVKGDWLNKYYSDKINEKPNMVILSDCSATHLNMHTLPLNRILDRTGMICLPPEDKKLNSGLPFLQTGDYENFKQKAKQTAEYLQKQGANMIVTSCPGSLTTLRLKYPELISGWDTKVLSHVEFLRDLVSDDCIEFETKENIRVIYHDPCYCSRHLGIISEPREILKKIPGISMLEFSMNKENSLCCGGGGMLPETFPNIADTMAETRAKQAADAGAEVIVTACPACKNQLTKGVSKIDQNKIVVLGILEFVLLRM